MAAQNTPLTGEAWFRKTEQRLRALERHRHHGPQGQAESNVQAEFLMRVQNLLMGGGTRTVITSGVYWSSPFRIMGVGMHPQTSPSGIFTIGIPPDGTEIPLHGESAIPSRTVGSGTTAGYVPLVGDESLWYDLPVAGSANIDTTGIDGLGFHIVHNGDTQVVIPSTWVRIISRQSLSGSSPLYVWGDMVPQG